MRRFGNQENQQAEYSADPPCFSYNLYGSPPCTINRYRAQPVHPMCHVCLLFHGQPITAILERPELVNDQIVECVGLKALR